MFQKIKLVSIIFLSVLSVHLSAHADVHPSALRSFSFRIRGEPETLDWNRAHTFVESSILTNLMEGLVTFAGGPASFGPKPGLKQDVKPALAQSWTISPDRKIYTFKLRPGVKWSDGVELTAQDFVYSWKRLLSPLTAASYAYLLFDIQGAEAFHGGMLQDFSQVGIKALDSLTLQVILAEPVAHWIEIPAFWVTFPLREDIVEQYGSMWATPGRMVTLGPFRLMSHDLDSQIVMRANVFYWGARGNLDQVIALIVKDDAVAMRLYQTGELDLLTDLVTVDPQNWLSRADLKIFPHFKTGFLAFVTDKYPVSNVKVRRAIAMAIDRGKLSRVLTGGQSPATSLVPPTLLGYSKTLGLTYNPSLAMIELRNSGIDPFSSPLSLDYIVPDWDKSKTIGNFIKQQLKQNLGIDVNLKPMDNVTYRSELDLHSFPIFDSTWTADYPDPDSFVSVFLSNSGNSRTTWKNQSFDQAVQLARQSEDSRQREKLYIQLQKILLEDEAVIIPLYYESNSILLRSRVKNFELNPMDFLYLKQVSVDF